MCLQSKKTQSLHSLHPSSVHQPGSIFEAHFRFNKAQSVEDSPAPSLLEWVWPSTRQKLHAAMSHGVTRRMVERWSHRTERRRRQKRGPEPFGFCDRNRQNGGPSCRHVFVLFLSTSHPGFPVRFCNEAEYLKQAHNWNDS